MVIAYPVKSGLYVNLTNRCPCACEFCLRKNGPGVYGSDPLWLEREPTLEEAMDDIDSKLGARAYSELVFCGYGEPTERLDVVLALARHVKAQYPSLPIRINTNGLSDLIHNRTTAPEMEGLIDTLSISLNTHDPEEYYRVCHPKFGPQSYAAMLEFTKAAVRHVPNVVMTVVDEPVTSRENQEKCRAIAEGLGAKLRVRPFES